MDNSVMQQAKLSGDEIFAVLKQLITEVIGEEFVEEMDITKESSFTRDLEMDSVEIVSFSEKVSAHFGKEIDFAGWLSGLDLDKIIELKLSDIIQYIETCQS